MKKIRFIFIFLVVFSSLYTKGQNETDALRFSMFNPTGTARFVSTGGAFGALGGDFSTLSVNPAGIAVYRSNEFTITPNLNFTRVQSSFLGETQEEINYDFALGNLGFVLTFNDPNALKESGWMGFQFGIGLNQLANFHNRRIYEGFNTQNSFTNELARKANMETNFNSSQHPSSFLDDYTTGLAWDALILVLDTVNNTFFVELPSDVLQSRVTNTSGSIRELNLSLGANYSNRLYLGATIGIPFLRFEEEYTFTERNSQNIDNEFQSMEFSESLTITGTGINFKVGAIYRITDMVRLGAALHTPTFFTLEDRWRTRMKSNLESYAPQDFSSPRLIYEYELNTPLRMIGSLGLVFGTNGLLSIDYEYADFTQMRLRSSNDLFTEENKAIQSSFQQQHTIRTGAEYRLNPIILRAGYALHTNPYNDDINTLEKTTISAGIGIRERSYFIDFGYFLTQYSEDFFPYYNFTGNRETPVGYDFNRQGFMMTVGFRF